MTMFLTCSQIVVCLLIILGFCLEGNDLQGVKAYFNLDTEGLFTLGTVLVDYRGYRITAQSIIPGKLTIARHVSWIIDNCVGYVSKAEIICVH